MKYIVVLGDGIAEPTFAALLHQCQPASVILVDVRQDGFQYVDDVMLVGHHLLQGHKVGVDVGEPCVYLPGNLQTVT